MSLNETRLNYFFFVGCAVAPLSILGSSLILTTIYRTRKGSKLTTYHRLLMGISIFDLFFSVALMFGPLPMPKGLGIPGAHGNTRSCTAQGFFIHLGSASICYCQMLMAYYVLVIRYNMSDSCIARRFEPFMHCVPILFYSFTAVLGLFLEVFNPNGSVCLIGPYPPFCEDNPFVECTRGEKFGSAYLVYSLTYPFLGWTFLICVWLLVVIFTVAQKIRQSRRFVFQDNGASPGERQMRQAIVQCLLYAFWFITFSILTSLNLLFDEAGREYKSVDAQFWLIAFAVFFFPLGGLVNFLIFIRPFYLAIRKEVPSDGRWFAFREAIWYPSALSIERARRGSSSREMSRRSALSGNRQGSSRRGSYTSNMANRPGTGAELGTPPNDGLGASPNAGSQISSSAKSGTSPSGGSVVSSSANSGSSSSVGQASSSSGGLEGISSV